MTDRLREAAMDVVLQKGRYADDALLAVVPVKAMNALHAALTEAARAPDRHEHRPEYPSSCTGCEHLAADLAARLPEGLLPHRASPDPANPAAPASREAGPDT